RSCEWNYLDEASGGTASGGSAGGGATRSITTRKIWTGVTGVSPASRGTRAIAFTTSTFSHCPQIVYFPSNDGNGASVIKKCVSFVSGPLFAIANRPGTSNLSDGTISRVCGNPGP